VLLAARDAGVRRLVFASSSSVYGSSLELPKSESGPALPMAPYAVAKLAGEGYCRSFWLLHGVETVTLRYFNVFGPRQREGHTYSGLLPRLFRAALAGATPTIFGDGEQSRDFTYVDNVVDANMLALETPGIGGEIFNVGCGERITVNRIVEALGDLLGQELRPEYREPRPGDMRHTQADLRLVGERLGYRPAIGFAEGLARTFEHHLTTLGRDARSAVA
jgi:UDP-glucose 4-epimerase